MSENKKRNCPACGTSSDTAKLFLEENIDTQQITGFTFASRKEPEYMCHHLVRCINCGLVYADAPPSQAELAVAYHEADYDSEEEGSDAAAAYARAIEPLLEKLPRRCSILEIGTGTAAFLELMKDKGFQQICGVEPSQAAIARAPAHRRAWIREGIFEPATFEEASFDLICCFMTLEHVRDPGELVALSLALLTPGGAFVSVTHDYTHWVNRLMGKRSPIIDIEHMQLFSRPSVEALFRNHGYTRVSSATFANRYSLRYWLRLLPVPGSMKKKLGNWIERARFGRTKVSINVGNVMASGFRPDGGP